MATSGQNILTSAHWARMWAKAWLEPTYRKDLEHSPLNGARKALDEWKDNTVKPYAKDFKLLDIEMTNGFRFSTWSDKELEDLVARKSSQEISIPSEWYFEGLRIPANPGPYVGSSRRPYSGREEPWESTPAQWDRVYAFIYHKKSKGDPSYKEECENDPRAALKRIAPQIGIEFTDDTPVIRIGDSPEGNGLSKTEIVEIMEASNAKGAQLIVRLSC